MLRHVLGHTQQLHRVLIRVPFGLGFSLQRGLSLQLGLCRHCGLELRPRRLLCIDFSLALRPRFKLVPTRLQFVMQGRLVRLPLRAMISAWRTIDGKSRQAATAGCVEWTYLAALISVPHYV